MTGNDVVDITLAAAESNWQRKGFMEKIFTRREQSCINSSANPARMLWKLWTMKESAYKLYCRLYGGRFFAPQKFSCILLPGNKGQVTYDGFCCQTISRITKNYVYSIARKSSSENDKFINECFRIPQTGFKQQQLFICQKIADQYKAILDSTAEHVFISKDQNGIPFLTTGNQLQVPVSITHHGRFAAFTIN